MNYLINTKLNLKSFLPDHDIISLNKNQYIVTINSIEHLHEISFRCDCPIILHAWDEDQNIPIIEFDIKYRLN